MSKAVKELVQKELAKRFDGITSMAVVDFTGVDAVNTSQIRKRLVSKGMQVMVVKNALAKQAFKTVGLEAAVQLLEGPCAIATGGDSVIEVIRELIDIRKEIPELTVKAAVLEGDAFGPDRIKELSQYPTHDEAIGKLVSCAMWPGALLAGCLLSPGRKVASLVKTIQDQAEGDAPPQDDGQDSAEAAAPAKEAAPAQDHGQDSTEAAAPAKEAAAKEAAPAQDDGQDSTEAAAPAKEAAPAQDDSQNSTEAAVPAKEAAPAQDHGQDSTEAAAPAKETGQASAEEKEK